ncbi:hypothetical protein OV079_07650 [Nannocystis pusilla]|uniref:Uncharacterized protein n=1 Tax=Nannocystis pusilla TaxID=889268 RepID=A0A9X3EKQ4_9BACT|nr:hypothetical protein [Nannocystis pusilla]
MGGSGGGDLSLRVADARADGDAADRSDDVADAQGRGRAAQLGEHDAVLDPPPLERQDAGRLGGVRKADVAVAQLGEHAPQHGEQRELVAGVGGRGQGGAKGVGPVGAHVVAVRVEVLEQAPRLDDGGEPMVARARERGAGIADERWDRGRRRLIGMGPRVVDPQAGADVGDEAIGRVGASHELAAVQGVLAGDAVMPPAWAGRIGRRRREVGASREGDVGSDRARPGGQSVGEVVSFGGADSCDAGGRDRVPFVVGGLRRVEVAQVAEGAGEGDERLDGDRRGVGRRRRLHVDDLDLEGPQARLGVGRLGEGERQASRVGGDVEAQREGVPGARGSVGEVDFSSASRGAVGAEAQAPGLDASFVRAPDLAAEEHASPRVCELEGARDSGTRDRSVQRPGRQLEAAVRLDAVVARDRVPQGQRRVVRTLPRGECRASVAGHERLSLRLRGCRARSAGAGHEGDAREQPARRALHCCRLPRTRTELRTGPGLPKAGPHPLDGRG